MHRTYLEFFAGGGMARAGLGAGWSCLLANDIDPAKTAAYAANWGGRHLRLADIETLSAADLPAKADLAWASFPCQDLSLAGRGLGLAGERSGTFWAFRRLMDELRRDDRAPTLIAIENVCGLLTARGGRDFADVIEAIASLGYRCGAMAIDAERFLPQSRPRLFIVAISDKASVASRLVCASPTPWTTPASLAAAHTRLGSSAAARWLWWGPPEPPPRNTGLCDVIDFGPSARWRKAEETDYILTLMSRLNREKVRRAQQEGRRAVGAIFRHTRRDPDGVRVQRAEVRFDDVAGCLRTPAGGSSRQTLLVVDGDRVRSRLMSPRECARLMGLPDDYVLPQRATDAYHLTGDGVVVPIVSHLARHLFEPLLAAQETPRLAAE
ncbi:MAG: DNA cytosine methyltransferase [Beijerinckiaceae bacterium]